MICLYLLQNPDHYTSHDFVPFYWRTFVSKARSDWEPNTVDEQPKLLLVKRNGKLIGLSSTFDYTHRPSAHDHYNLYDWISQYHRIRKPKQKNSQVQEEGDVPLKVDKYVFNNFTFLSGHPLYDTHVPVRRSNWANVVPNFLGGILPRPDKDDREYYCCTMLVLFSPWRSGKDLKSEHQSWHDAFISHEFPPHTKIYMQNMNLRYEALDARDDFRAQIKSGNVS
ncbi:hypothetical protein FB446DRAFT_642002, partial [Lentinula raphanica]